jgi:hypothetical protein
VPYNVFLIVCIAVVVGLVVHTFIPKSDVLFLVQKVGSDHLALACEFAFTPRTKEGNNKTTTTTISGTSAPASRDENH